MSRVEPPASPGEVIRGSYAEPIDSPSLAQVARSKLEVNPAAGAVIVVSDNTRPVPYGGPGGIPVPLLETLLEAGFTSDRITFSSVPDLTGE